MNASRFWATNAIAIGAWETAAILTRRPTISELCARSRQAHPRVTLIGLVAWSSGLVAYLYTKRI